MNKKNIKFEQLFDINDWEVDTPSGWKDIVKIGKTIPYQKWIVATKNFKLQCADEHIVYNKSGEVFVKDLHIGDEIETINGFEKVVHISDTQVYENMYDIQVDGHEYYSNGIKSHNTLVLVNFAIEWLLSGCNVLYVTLEISENDIVERIDENLFQINTSSLQLIDKGVYYSKVNELKNKTQGKLFVKEYPTLGANVNHISHLIDDIRLKYDTKIDFVIVDYLNIMSSTKHKTMDNLYTYVGSITGELRGLAVNKEIGLITATQTNRGGLNSVDLELSDTSDSIGTAFIADLMLAVMQPEELRDKNQYLFKQIKSRYAPINARNQRWLMGVDRETQRLFELLNPTAGLVRDDASDVSIGVGLKDDSRDSKDFSGFKF